MPEVNLVLGVLIGIPIGMIVGVLLLLNHYIKHVKKVKKNE